MKALTGISVSEKAKYMNGNSDQRLFHILVKNSVSYPRLLWSFFF